ncbi:MAG: hypothetical protein KDD62_15065, partial [Bdellovibrionales bacterium]|nr:hypothetical protein [Bdellovibrionales bacterium]
MKARNTLLVLSLGWLLFVSPLAALTLTEPSSGLEVDVPAGGYSLTLSEDGSYVLSKKKAKVRFVLGRSALDVNGTADDFIANSKFKKTKDKREGNLVSLSGTLDGKKIDVTFRTVGENIEVATFSGKSSGKKKGKKK